MTLSNWQRAPFNRWSFQHVGQLVPSARVDRGDGPVFELHPDPVWLDDVQFTSLDGTQSSLGAFLESTCTDGFIVLHHGRLVAERYFNGMSPRTPHLLQSVSKSLSGTLAGALIAAGAVAPEDLVTGHVPELHATSFDGATVRHLLDMTAGTSFTEEYDDPEADVRAYERAAGWQPLRPGEEDLDLLGYMSGLSNGRPHGELFEYRSILTDVLGVVLERAGGAPLAELVSRHVWRPMGAEHDAQLTVDRKGGPLADGGFSVTLRDLARLGQLYVLGGCVDGRQVVPSQWIADTRYASQQCRRIFAASPGAAEALCSPAERACRPLGHYRNQWWVLDPARGVMLAAGIYGQYIYIDLTADVVIAKLSSLPSPLDIVVAADTLSAFAAVSIRLAGPA